MNKQNTKCRVCGKEYFCCSDSKNIGSWRTMACSLDCFKEYMNRIEKSRNQTQKEANAHIPKTLSNEKSKNRKKKVLDLDMNQENTIIEN